jgi:hypothetical protein
MTINTKTYYASNDFLIKDDEKGKPYAVLHKQGVDVSRIERAAHLCNLILGRRSKRGFELKHKARG